MDDRRREIRGGFVLVEGGRILAVGPPEDLPVDWRRGNDDERLDLSGHVVLPGLVNTHHHMFQSLTRALPAAQDADLFGWLRTLYPVWSRLSPEMIRLSTRTAMAELLLSGCTTTSDHLYLFPNGARLDDQIEAAAEMGMRFHAARGAMSVGESGGGLPPDALVENEDAILRDTERVIDRFHDPARFAMLRIAVAPCSPFSVSRELMRDAALLARQKGVGLHTHLAENDDDVRFSRERFGMTPAEYAAELGWVGPDVWHAHCVKLDAPGMRRLGAAGTGAAHCPCSNMRLGSGIAPVRRMRAAGMRVGLGVDGSASNDSGHLLGEARQAMLLARVQHDPADGAMMTARDALEIATRGGAAALNRDDIGVLAPGMAADVVAFPTGDAFSAGAEADPLGALMFCQPRMVGLNMVNGRVLVRDGALVHGNMAEWLRRHRAAAITLMSGG
ncbi:8-oxoguanine deaminase [Acetobacteraceae bacterium KSS12]|uniref:8-oxoguanine deaminase n=2 Tax=Rhizosaccharibacter radicis TaxID=2782605 RepID=A0ABT1VT51_9PROT|nr:8-oxoguanine deaminase [Acetobacteraceae bacterium KSS12]